MSFTPPTVAEFKEYFDRDFKYGAGKESVRDKDIQRALDEVPTNFNESIWDEASGETERAFLYVAAHFLALDMQTAGGLKGNKGVDSRGGGITQSKSVGQISVTYAISPRILNDPNLSGFQTTGYGVRYLQMLTPRLAGNIATVGGRPAYLDV